MSAEAPVTIERLSVRWRGAAGEAHALSTRLRLERLIGTLDLRPPEMPPGAVLLVRRVAGLPPLTRLDRLSPEWVRQVQQRMSELYRSARPPASAPPDALCVVFADAADMLQQFTRAVVREPTSFVQQWYWRELVPPPAAHSPGAALAAVWAAQAQAVPPTLARLPLPEVCAALALLAPAEVGAVVRALAQHYALPSAVLPAFALSPAAVGAAPPASPQAEVWRALLPAAPLPQPLPALPRARAGAPPRERCTSRFLACPRVLASPRPRVLAYRRPRVLAYRRPRVFASRRPRVLASPVLVSRRSRVLASPVLASRVLAPPRPRVFASPVLASPRPPAQAAAPRRHRNRARRRALPGKCVWLARLAAACCVEWLGDARSAGARAAGVRRR
jgi:hypothetical protein